VKENILVTSILYINRETVSTSERTLQAFLELENLTN